MYKVKVYKNRYEGAENVIVHQLNKGNNWYAQTHKSGTVEDKKIHAVKYFKDGNRWECTCADFEYRHIKCKHIIAVLKEYVNNMEFEFIKEQNDIQTNQEKTKTD